MSLPRAPTCSASSFGATTSSCLSAAANARVDAATANSENVSRSGERARVHVRGSIMVVRAKLVTTSNWANLSSLTGEKEGRPMSSPDEPAEVTVASTPASAEQRKRQQREWTAHEVAAAFESGQRAEPKAKVAATPPAATAGSTAPGVSPRAEEDAQPRGQRFPAPDLPEGWSMEIRTRGQGLAEGQTYTLWYPPDGRKVLRSRKEVERFLAGGYAATKEAKPLPEPAPGSAVSSTTARSGQEGTARPGAERCSGEEDSANALRKAARLVGDHYSAYRTQLLRLSSQLGPQSANPGSELAVIFQSLEHALHRFLAIIREWYASRRGAQGREGCLALGFRRGRGRKFHQFAAVLMNNQLRYLVSTKAMRQSMQMSRCERRGLAHGSARQLGPTRPSHGPGHALLVDPRGLASSQPSRFVATAAPPRQQPLYVPAAPGYGHRAPAAQPASTLDRTPIDTLLAQRVPPAQAMLALLAHIQRAASAADEPPRPRERRPTQGSATPLPTVLETVAMALGSRR